MQIEHEGRGDDGTEQSIGAIYSQMSVQIKGEGRGDNGSEHPICTIYSQVSVQIEDEGRGGDGREHPTVFWKTREDKVGETKIMDIT